MQKLEYPVKGKNLATGLTEIAASNGDLKLCEIVCLKSLSIAQTTEL
ncbi:hypothetical protein GPUN_0340 [Glaciecola punicea ACAM 611]|uniref:Uncharacterized protein n=1 Tax=Glaciecola punicea ACAM 611 TaxID=1121923 RepID=H5T860_9ALTE|nr:hypothetical protein GPUN_0340 [Glaciecola punicea ACAM 611]